MIWVEATPLCGRRMRLFVDGLKSVVMIWGRLRLFVGGGYASLWTDFNPLL
jgi:hypothetical protein